jgi:2-haloacid dehalogenase
MTSTRPSVVVFDVNETLSDMSPLSKHFIEAGLPEHQSTIWFTSVLRDGFALAAAGSSRSFADIAAENLRALLAAAQPEQDSEQAVNRIMQAMSGLGVHPDVVPGIHKLSADGYRLVTLTNGAVQISEGLLTRAGIRDRFERLLSVEDAPAWKPAHSAYRHAMAACDTEPSRMLLVAVHPWDIHGAAQAGLRTAWINRNEAAYPRHFGAPDITSSDMKDLAEAIRKT